MPQKIKIRCITNRHLARQDYFEQIRQIAMAGPEAIIVREKDMPEHEYEQLAAKVMEICRHYDVLCILHAYPQSAIRLGAKAVHLPLQSLFALTEKQKQFFSALGASVHSKEEALMAQKAGASYLAAGHIFATDCKRGLPPKGLPFLKEICEMADIPVYALGGIQAGNAAECLRAGAEGVCVMSECMKHTDLREVFAQYVCNNGKFILTDSVQGHTIR